MNDFNNIQKILKKNNIGFLVNKEERDMEDGKYHLITLVAKRSENVTGYTEFFTNLYFNKKNKKLEKVEILE